MVNKTLEEIEETISSRKDELIAEIEGIEEDYVTYLDCERKINDCNSTLRNIEDIKFYLSNIFGK